MKNIHILIPPIAQLIFGSGQEITSKIRHQL